jgi:beta-glucosidase/6-phospho-beta-glucosidase/beta-galactosidase
MIEPANNFGEIYPEGMYRILRTIYQRTRTSLSISQNGFNDALDNHVRGQYGAPGDDSSRDQRAFLHAAIYTGRW